MAYTKKSEAETNRNYYYSRCTHCNRKVHMNARTCFYCGKDIDISLMRFFVSKDEEDHVFCMSLNLPDKCMNCVNVQKGAKPCYHTGCFATEKGRQNIDGRCNTCYGTRAECCRHTYNSQLADAGNIPVSKRIKQFTTFLAELIVKSNPNKQAQQNKEI